jgi:hypothetical protein
MGGREGQEKASRCGWNGRYIRYVKGRTEKNDFTTQSSVYSTFGRGHDLL